MSSSNNRSVSRRDFLKLAGLGLGAMAFRPLTSRPGIHSRNNAILLPDFPQADLLGRNCTADTNLSGGKIELKVRPDVNSALVRDVYRDEVFPWLKEVSAENIDFNLPNQRWVETPEGYIHSLYLQPCRNLPNTPFSALPEGRGFWAEVTVPYVDLYMDNPSPASGWMRDHVAYGLQPRLYYSQIMWIDNIRVMDSGTIQYHVNERYGNPGDLFWAEGAAFRPLTDEDVSPINPEVAPATKKIIVNLSYQTLTCKEGDHEVYFCRVSTGVQEGSTPLGDLAVWRKAISIRMGANTVASSYDLPGISWTTLISGEGVAIHAATSHNDFGTVRSHGCVNCKPEDAKWIFRWSQPTVPLEPGNLEWHDWSSGSTHVIVEDTF
ncbi:MAG: L,D-transpeptidase [Firmicutes bacterium]|nr:L,D-transpeptidase [Bacillota bacterium]